MVLFQNVFCIHPSKVIIRRVLNFFKYFVNTKTTFKRYLKIKILLKSD